ncbi:hypothetical protein [Actinocorallia sp. A-T 12471]|uniref:hypothetical protein n=1 Tax=Actinocorallia sp. A-T 12471 TaxID=3089813 RepID=UPI0029CED8AD|nr:hypothetical protein [Actinocorallia sp. A-T 12471]MDX6743722.1 hypothetical protein [Actinocorallia sp. A-T 12471]
MIKLLLCAASAAAVLATTPSAFASTSTIPAAPPPAKPANPSTAVAADSSATAGARLAAPKVDDQLRRYRVSVRLDLQDHRRDRSLLEVQIQRSDTNRVLRDARACLQRREVRGYDRRFVTVSCRRTDRFGQTGWVLRNNRTYRVFVPGTRTHYARYTYSFSPDL